MSEVRIQYTYISFDAKKLNSTMTDTPYLD